jgi:hypothetical protein
MSRRVWLPVLALAISLVPARNAEAMSIRESNIVDLLRESNDIVVGQVRSVTDGIDERGVPYTEVTLDIEDTIRGDLSGTYTFRQFGLRDPRPTPDGKMMMMPAPEGFPRYAAGRTQLLFLHPVARWTGLRTTARVAPGLATAAEKRMMAADGAANPDSFLTFVKRAVRERWVETGRMAHAQGAR